MMDVPPRLPLGFYEALSRLTGRRSEQARIFLSTILGRPETRRNSRESRHWKQFERYRSAASVCDPAAIALWRTLARAKPRGIVEFGTGFSTFVIAAFARHIGGISGRQPTIVTVEHDKDWLTTQQKFLDEAGLREEVHLVYGPMEVRSYFGREVMCYSAIEDTLSNLDLLGRIDFVFVDGPPAKMFGAAGRRGSTLQALSICEPGGTILIHDALRGEEYDIIQEFHHDSELPFASHGIIPLWYGLAICQKS